MKKWIRVLPILGVAVLAAGIGHQSALAKKSEDSVIADRIFIGDVAVGGMTDDEATAAVEKYVDDLADEKITLTINDVCRGDSRRSGIELAGHRERTECGGLWQKR